MISEKRAAPATDPGSTQALPKPGQHRRARTMFASRRDRLLEPVGRGGLDRVCIEPAGKGALEIVVFVHVVDSRVRTGARSSASSAARRALIDRLSRDLNVPTGMSSMAAASASVIPR